MNVDVSDVPSDLVSRLLVQPSTSFEQTWYDSVATVRTAQIERKPGNRTSEPPRGRHISYHFVVLFNPPALTRYYKL